MFPTWRSLLVDRSRNDVEHLSYLRGVLLPLRPPLELVQLLHVEVLERSHVLQQRQPVGRGEPAQGTMEHSGLVLPEGGAALHQVLEERDAGVVAAGGGVQLQLVRRIRVVVARVAPDLHSAWRRRVLELPLVPRPALLDVVDVLQSLEVLVSLAVQLEVGFEVGLVRAQLAHVVAGDDGEDLLLPEPRPVLAQVPAELLEAVAAEDVAHAALVCAVGVGVGGLRRRLHGLRVEAEVGVRGHVGARQLAPGHHLDEERLVVGHVGERRLRLLP